MSRSPDDPRLAPITLRRELIAQGFDDRAIGRMTANGTLHRVRYGSYAPASAWAACDEVGQHGLVARAVLKRAQSDVVLSHQTALAEWEVPLWDLTLSTVHVTRRDMRAGRRESGVHQHLGELRADDVVELNGQPVTSATRTALDAMTVLDTEHGVAVAGDLLHRKLTTTEALEEGRAFMESWPHTLSQKLVLQIVDGRCESVGEHRTLYLICTQGLPIPEPQYPIYDRSGRVVAYLDFAWPDLGAYLEFDGKVKYEKFRREGESPSDVAMRERRREVKINELTDWRPIRLVWSDLYRPERTAAKIRSVLNPLTSRAG